MQWWSSEVLGLLVLAGHQTRTTSAYDMCVDSTSSGIPDTSVDCCFEEKVWRENYRYLSRTYWYIHTQVVPGPWFPDTRSTSYLPGTVVMFNVRTGTR